MRLIPAAIVAATLVGATACTSTPTPAPRSASSSATATPRDGRPTVAPVVTPSATTCGWGDGSGTDAPTYRGMTVDAARARAVAEGLTVRELGADGVCFSRTDDLRSDRINFYSERGVVVWARLF